MDVEGKGDREGSDVTHPRGSRFGGNEVARRDTKGKYESRHQEKVDNEGNDGPRMEGRGGKGSRGDGWGESYPDSEDAGGTWSGGGWGGS
jgi:hypothetical protein